MSLGYIYKWIFCGTRTCIQPTNNNINFNTAFIIHLMVVDFVMQNHTLRNKKRKEGLIGIARSLNEVDRKRESDYAIRLSLRIVLL